MLGIYDVRLLVMFCPLDVLLVLFATPPASLFELGLVIVLLPTLDDIPPCAGPRRDRGFDLARVLGYVRCMVTTQ